MDELIGPEPGLNAIEAPGPIASFVVTMIEGQQNLRRPSDRIRSLLPFKPSLPSDGDVTTVVGIIPIAETFGFSNDIRAASQGRAVWNTENLGFEPLPPQLFEKVVGEIRTRKGLKPEPNPESYYSD